MEQLSEGISLASETDTRQRIVANGAIVNAEGKILLIQRSEKEKFLPSYFDLTGGKVELGEDPRKAVVREAFEESGIRTQVLGVHTVWSYIAPYNFETTQFVVLGFMLEPINNDYKVVAENGQIHRWISKEDLDRIKISEDLKKELNSAFDWLEKTYKI